MTPEHPIDGVSTSAAAFAGITERGPEEPLLTASLADYQRWFGGDLPDTVSYLPHAVRGFFENGGRRLFIARAAGVNAQFASLQTGPLLIRSVGRGAWGNRIFVRIRSASNGSGPDRFEVTLLYYTAMPPVPLVDPLSNDPGNRANPDRREPDVVERFDGLSQFPGASNNAERVINAGSSLVRVWLDTHDPSPVPQGAAPDFVTLGTDGADGDPVGEAAYASCLAAIEAVVGDEMALVAVPDETRFAGPGTTGPVTAAVIRHCERLPRQFGIVSSERGRSDASQLGPPGDTRQAAFYYPWIDVNDPATGGTLRMPPTGPVAGVIARTDIERGVHKAPANEELRGALDVEFSVADSTQDVLNPRGVNVIRDFRAAGRGIRVWGARTMSSDPDWKYINVRRFVVFLEASIGKGTEWVGFEENGEPLWTRVRSSINDFLLRIWRSGALMGHKPEQAFFVRLDRTTMTQDDIDNGRLIGEVGVAPLRPAEFVIFRIGQKTAAGGA